MWIEVCKSADPIQYNFILLRKPHTAKSGFRACSSPNPWIRHYFCSNPTPHAHPETEVKKFEGKLVIVNASVNFAQNYDSHAILITVPHPSLNELCSKKEIIWMNSLTHRPRLKKDLRSKFRFGRQALSCRFIPKQLDYSLSISIAR